MRASRWLTVAVFALGCRGDGLESGASGEAPPARVDTLALSLESVLVDRGAMAMTGPASVGGGRIGETGEVFLLDPLEAAVRVYSSSGDFTRSFGRRGEGPAEFRSPTWLGLLRDSAAAGVLLWDASRGSLARFDVTGTPVASIPVDPGRTAQRGQPFLGILAGDRIPLILVPSGYGPDTPTGLLREAATVDLFTLEGRPLGPIFEDAGSELFHYERNGRRVVVRPVLGDVLLRTVAGGVLWLVHSRSGRVRAIDGEGRTLVDATVALPRRELTPEALARARTAASVSRPAPLVGLFGEAQRAAPAPAAHPLIQGLAGDSEGGVWLSGYPALGDDLTPWIRLDATTSTRRVVLLPNGERILDWRRGRLLATAEDDLGRVTVRMYRTTPIP